MKKFKFGLLPKIIVAIILGICLGMFTPETPVRIFVTFNGLFSEFLGFLIPLIIVGLVTPAIADIGKGLARCSSSRRCSPMELRSFRASSLMEWASPYSRRLFPTT